MRKICFLSATLFLLASAHLTALAQSAPGPGWSRDQIKNWCDSSCADCRDFNEVIDSKDESFSMLSYTASCGTQFLYYFDSTSTCYQYEESWPSAKDTVSIIKYFETSTACQRVSRTEWKETLYGKNKKPLDCCVYWSLRAEPYRGALLIGELRQSD